MEPTLKAGGHIDVNQDPYDSAAPQVGDIVVFHPPEGAIDQTCGNAHRVPGQSCDSPTTDDAPVLFVKRIVAGPGDTVAIVGGQMIRNGRRVAESFIRPCGSLDECNFPKPITVPDDEFFVLGDNRGQSDDSRFWGPVHREAIVGRVDSCLPLKLLCKHR